MKRVKIFLASSIEDLREDRLQVGDFFRQLNEIYLDSGVHFSLIKCEDYDNSIAAGGKQQEYDREIRESELVFFLFFRKVGDYTRHEFEVALEAFKNQKKPRIITYFKYITSIEDAAQEVRDFMQLLDQEMKHYYNTYGHIDTLKLGVLMQIKLLQLDSAQIKLEDGVVRLNGQAVAKAENVPMLRGNQTLRELTEKRRQLQAALQQCRKAYLEDPAPENETAFFRTSAELNRVSRQLTAVEQETMALLTTVAEMTSDGRVLTHRQKEALKHFNAGDYAAVQAILKDEERENELLRAQLRAEVAKNEIQGYVEEELLLIKTEKAQGLTEARVKRILSGYQKVAELVEKHDLKKNVLYDYAAFLKNQNQYAEALAVAEKLRWYYAAPSLTVEEEAKGSLYNLLGILYEDTQRYEEAEAVYIKALETVAPLAAQNPEVYAPDLAMIYNNLGALYRNTQRYGESEETYGKALEIYSRLAAQNPDARASLLADSYNNLGVLYEDTQRYEEAEAAYIRALEVYGRLAAQNPDAYEQKLAGSYNNLGILYGKIKRYAEAEEAYSKALDIRTRLAARNPDAYEPDLATSCNNLGALYQDTQRYEEAEKAYGMAKEVFGRLAAQNPETYEPDLAMIYNNLGVMYQNTQRYEEAEEAYGKALEFYGRLADRNPDAYEPDLATIHNNLGVFYQNIQFHEKAEESHSKCLEIRIRMAARNPEHYQMDLAKSYYNLGVVYSETLRYRYAEEAFGRALDIYTRLAAQDPDGYEPELANILWNLAAIYAAQAMEEKLLTILLAALPLYEKLAQKYPGQYQEEAALIRKLLSDE